MKLLDIVLIAIIIILALVLEGVIKQKNKLKDAPKENKITTENKVTTENKTEYPYKKKMLLTKNEYVFYNILKEKCDKQQLIICPKVRMEDFLQVTDSSNKLKYRGYIKSRHIDFMLCDNKLHLLAGIELDDSTHNQPDVQEKDNFKNEVFKTIQLPLFRIKTTYNSYNEQIDSMLKELLNNDNCTK